MLQQQASQHSLTQLGCFIHQLGMVQHGRVLVRASCGHSQCYRVVTVQCVTKGFEHQRDPLLCPAHSGHYRYFSTCVTQFFTVLQTIGYQGVVVWDWHDVPGQPRMHWDATVFLHGSAHRFEIDGPSHDLVNGTRRIRDVTKDAVVKQNPVYSLLRLSYHDRLVWALTLQLYIQGRIQHMYGGVWGTAWYLPFGGQGHGMLGII